MSSNRNLALPSALVLIGAILTGAACGGGGETAESPAAAAEQASQLAAGFTIDDVHGNKVSLSDSAGQVRLIDFWATWCAPCREEIPMFKELHQIYGEQGFSIIAISDENAGIVKTFVAENELPYTNLIDPGEVSTQYQVVSLPTAFLIDGEGRIVQDFRGPKPRRILEKKIRELLELPPAT